MENSEILEKFEMTRRGFVGLSASAAMTLFLTGCASEGSNSDATSSTETGGTFTFPINSNSLASLTPYRAIGNDDKVMAATPCFDPLFILTSNAGTRWYVAESLTDTTGEGVEWEMKIREGIKWHDGEPLTAEDVVWSIQVQTDSNNGGVAETTDYPGNELTAELVDDTTVKLTLKKPFSAFETLIGRTFVLPKHVFGESTTIKDATENLNKCIGSGPFKLKAYNEGDSIVYERNDDYWRGAPSLDEVVIKLMPSESAQEAALQSNELSAMRVVTKTKLDKYKEDSNYKIWSIPEGRLNYLGFNCRTEIMSNMDARKAICLALNADEIITGAYGSTELATRATNFCSPENLYYNDTMEGYQQNIEEAKALAENCGLAGMTLNYIYNNERPNMKETAQIVEQQLQAINVNLSITAMDTAQFLQSFFSAMINPGVDDQSWDLGSNGVDQLNGDPGSKFGSLCGNKGGLQDQIYVSDATYDLWLKATEAIDTTEREKYFKELQEQMLEDYCMFPMANTNYVMAAVNGFTGLDTIKRYPAFEDYTKISKA